MTTPVKKSQETRYNLDPVSFFINHSLGRRPDGVAINKSLQIQHILEFEQSTDRDEGFLWVKEAEEKEEHKSVISALIKSALKCEFEQIFRLMLLVLLPKK